MSIDRVILITAFIIYAITFCIAVYMNNATKQGKPVNKVHFYVARDKIGTIWLYIGKPKRNKCLFCSTESSIAITSSKYFSKCGLDANNYANLKWEDEPVEVFLNLKD